MKRSFSPAFRFGSTAVVLVIATMLSAVGCGASSASNPGLGESKVTSAVPAGETPHTLGDAEAQFAMAEQSVFGAFNQDKRITQGQFAQPPGTQTPTYPAPVATEASPPPHPKDADSAAKEGEFRAGATSPGGDAQSLSSSPCETACRALASMNRAMTHICTLAGEDSDSCTNARERVRSATERVRQSCSECS